jgi:hypothetical protein
MKIFILATIALVILFTIYKIFTGDRPVEYRAIIQPLNSTPKPKYPYAPPPAVLNTPSPGSKPGGQPAWVPKPILIQPLTPRKK